jgi:SAM-dependent methyltransferase
MPTYFDYAHNPDLLARIPLDARSVLDVGCGDGALGAAYRRLNPRARLLGIEQNPEAAAIAAKRLDEVVAMDIESGPVPFLVPGGIDCIVYGDVLEHMRDPWAVLRAHMDALADAGTILICVPNVEHWSFTDRLLRGTWEYEPEGLLDATHLRWFTEQTMRRGLEALGLTVCDVSPRIFGAEKAAAFTAALAPALAAIGVDADDYARRAAPLQYVWRVCKQPQPVLTVAASMLAPVGGVSHVRIVDPLVALASDPWVRTHLMPGGEVARHGADDPRIFILHRPALIGQEGADTIRALLADDWLIVTEFDDHPDFFKVMQGEHQYAFRGVHAVQTSTPALAAVLRTRNPEVAVFPNTIRALPDVNNFADPNRLTLFFGALNREQDWAPLMPTLNAVAATAGDRLHFSVVHDAAFFAALETPHKRFTPTCDYDTYMQLLGQSEISLMPLNDTAFNRTKSDLKFIEAGACRVVPLASPVVYADSVEDGRTGLLFADPEELRTRLLRLIATPELARGIAGAARAYVAGQRMLAYQVAPRIAWYRSLWERRIELGEALLARVREMPPAP